MASGKVCREGWPSQPADLVRLRGEWPERGECPEWAEFASGESCCCCLLLLGGENGLGGVNGRLAGGAEDSRAALRLCSGLGWRRFGSWMRGVRILTGLREDRRLSTSLAGEVLGVSGSGTSLGSRFRMFLRSGIVA